MKTSNKLLIVFFILIPSMLLAFNLMLKDQLVKGNIIKRRMTDNPPLAEVQLQPFRHLVVNGQLMYRRGNREKSLGQRQQVDIFVGKDKRFNLKVYDTKKDLPELVYKGDTLFLSFRLTNLNDQSQRYFGAGYWLSAPSLASVAAQDGDLMLHLEQRAPFALRLEKWASCEVRRLNVPKAKLDLEDATRINILAIAADTLAYSLGRSAEIRFKRPYQIKTLQPGTLQPESSITVGGSAQLMDTVILSSRGVPEVVTEK